jgi:superfamily II DNA/RNA helicase
LKFIEFGFESSLMEGIASSGYENATPVQEQVIPLILQGKDIIASAQTGTGKTAAFLLPLINQLIKHKHSNHISAMIIVPTRELAVQISQHMEGLSYFTDVSSIAVYGGGDGGSFVDEKRALMNGVDVVICTPGKMISHLNMGYVNLKKLQFLVLDEADRMLDMGFNEDILRIITHIAPERQNLLFSATMPPKIRELARKILKNPAEINISLSKPPDRIQQEAFIVFEPQKIPLVVHLLKPKHFKSVVVFCSKKQSVKQLTAQLKRSGIVADEIHSDLEQAGREEVLLAFKNKRLPVLVATDIISRGIDIEDIDLVINYDVPNDGEDYVHRIGRTARAETKGIAYTFVNEQEQRKFSEIEQLIEKVVDKTPLPAEIGEGPEYKPMVKRFNPRPQGHKPGGGGQHRKPQHKKPNHQGGKPPAKPTSQQNSKP